MKFNFKSYFKPTPVKLRQLGDTILAIGGALAVYQSDPLAIKITIGCTIVGKALTNFFTDEPAQP